MADDEKLDLLDLDDEIDLPELPEGEFAPARPRRPWLLFGAALIVIILATYIIVRLAMRGGNNDTVEINLDVPENKPVAGEAAPDAQNDFAASANKVIAGQNDSTGVPVRVVEERKAVEFKPDAPKVETPKLRPAETATTTAATAKSVVSKPATTATTTVKPQTTAVSNFYVQFGSYGTRAGAEAAQKTIRAAHESLFAGKQFVILAAVLPNGSTTYRLRIGFATSTEASGFCQNAKSDGLDCYVAK